MSLYFTCRINKTLLQTVFFGNFAHWVYDFVPVHEMVEVDVDNRVLN